MSAAAATAAPSDTKSSPAATVSPSASADAGEDDATGEEDFVYSVSTTLPPELTAESFQSAAAASFQSQNRQLVSTYRASKLDKEAVKNWDRFYHRNQTNFFKDRHYLQKELHELKECTAASGHKLLEVGCGVGNALFPLLEDNPHLSVYGIDCSKRAIDFIKGQDRYGPFAHRSGVWVCNISGESFPSELTAKGGVDFATLIFVLSALTPGDAMRATLKRVFDVLKPGGLLFIRDYAVYDMTQLRFKTDSKISENYYVRSDGTRTFFFSTAGMSELLESVGFVVTQNVYHFRTVENKKLQSSMKRNWIQIRCVGMNNSRLAYWMVRPEWTPPGLFGPALCHHRQCLTHGVGVRKHKEFQKCQKDAKAGGEFAIREIRSHPGGGDILRFDGPSHAPVMEWDICLNGPAFGPYKGGRFWVRVRLPSDYPMIPPELELRTPIYHPSWDENGYTFMEVTTTKWSPALRVDTLMMDWMCQMSMPSTHRPAIPSIAYQYEHDRSSFERIGREWVQKYALATEPPAGRELYAAAFATLKLDQPLPPPSPTAALSAAPAVPPGGGMSIPPVPGPTPNANHPLWSPPGLFGPALCHHRAMLLSGRFSLNRITKEYQKLLVAGGAVAAPPTSGSTGVATASGVIPHIADMRFGDGGQARSFRFSTKPGLLLDWHFALRGPDNSPYSGGLYWVSMAVPFDYPMAPPLMHMRTPIYHCNFDERGRTCLDIESNKWSPALQFSTLLLSWYFLLNGTNAEDYSNRIIAEQYKSNRALHDKTAREWTLKYAHPSVAANANPPTPDVWATAVAVINPKPATAADAASTSTSEDEFYRWNAGLSASGSSSGVGAGGVLHLPPVSLPSPRLVAANPTAAGPAPASEPTSGRSDDSTASHGSTPDGAGASGGDPLNSLTALRLALMNEISHRRSLEMIVMDIRHELHLSNSANHAAAATAPSAHHVSAAALAAAAIGGTSRRHTTKPAAAAAGAGASGATNRPHKPASNVVRPPRAAPSSAGTRRRTSVSGASGGGSGSGTSDDTSVVVVSRAARILPRSSRASSASKRRASMDGVTQPPPAPSDQPDAASSAVPSATASGAVGTSSSAPSVSFASPPVQPSNAFASAPHSPASGPEPAPVFTTNSGGGGSTFIPSAVSGWRLTDRPPAPDTASETQMLVIEQSRLIHRLTERVSALETQISESRDRALEELRASLTAEFDERVRRVCGQLIKPLATAIHTPPQSATAPVSAAVANRLARIKQLIDQLITNSNQSSTNSSLPPINPITISTTPTATATATAPPATASGSPDSKRIIELSRNPQPPAAAAVSTPPHASTPNAAAARTPTSPPAVLAATPPTVIRPLPIPSISSTAIAAVGALVRSNSGTGTAPAHHSPIPSVHAIPHPPASAGAATVRNTSSPLSFGAQSAATSNTPPGTATTISGSAAGKPRPPSMAMRPATHNPHSTVHLRATSGGGALPSVTGSNNKALASGASSAASSAASTPNSSNPASPLIVPQTLRLGAPLIPVLPLPQPQQQP